MRGRGRIAGGRTGAALAVVCALLVGAAAGSAVSRDDASPIRACYRVAKDGTPARNATLRLIANDESCRRNERLLAWSQRGLPGPPGPAGPPGPPGPAGPSTGGGGGGGVDCDLERRIDAAVPNFQTSPACAPPPLCNEDGFEHDDTIAQASPVDLGTTTSGRACAGNDDVFAVAAGGNAVTATVTFETTAVLEVALLDASGRVLARASGSSPQVVSVPAGSGGTVYVRIRAVDAAQGAYTLVV